VATTSWDPQGEAKAALRTIVADPQYGAAALSSSQVMTNLLKDLLPDAPREASVLVAASESGLAESLQNHVAQGMDPDTALRLAAGSLESRTALTPEACAWAAQALITALRLDATAGSAKETVLPDDETRDAVVPDGQKPGTGDKPTGPPGAVAGPAGPRGLGRAAAGISILGVLLVIWGCALPDIHWTGSGRTSASIFNPDSGGGLWYAVEPIGVAIVGVTAAVLLVLAARSAWLRLLAAGMLMAFGIQSVLLFVGYQFAIQKPNHPGSGAAVGILGALLLLAAGVLAAIRRAPRAAPPVAAR
jgi:hypothetical protein